MTVLGVDACKAGWVGIRLDDGVTPAAFCASTIEELVDLAGAVDVVGIDIPIGLTPRPACDSPGRDQRAVTYPHCLVQRALAETVFDCGPSLLPSQATT